MTACPVCGSDRLFETVRRAKLPVFQNVVWPSRDEAIAAPAAPFALGTCLDCGFSFNTAFNAAIVDYDESYDNNVSSSVYRDYLGSLAHMLAARFDLTGGTVYDIGCGKGEFLEILCAAAPGITGIGIDPSCTPVERDRLKLIAARFEECEFAPDTRLVVVRHVLEHIAEPVAFLRQLRACVPDVPIYIEVPDLGWILENNAFWDFCYEHCNYFTQASLAACLSAAGFAIDEQQPSYGGQYQWALCRPGEAVQPAGNGGADAVAAVQAYAGREAAQIVRIEDLARKHGEIAIWGMATKGVILCSILGSGRVSGGIDENANKHGFYAAGSGVRINPPEWTRDLAPGSAALIMNPNYAGEIAERVRGLGVHLELLAV